jgi:hypothetical protein
MKSILMAMTIALTVISLSINCLAATSKQIAAARVTTALALLEIADSRAILPDKPPRESIGQPAPEVPGTVPKPLSGGTHVESGTLPLVVPPIPAPDSSVVSPPDGGKTPHVASGSFTPMRLIPLASSTGEPFHEHLPAQLVIKGWASGCSVCENLKRNVKSILGPRGWSSGASETSQIRFVTVPQTEKVPQIVLMQNGIEIKRWDGYQDPGMLSNRLRDAWDKAPNQHPMQASGSAGAIACGQQIRNGAVYWRKYVGEGNDVHISLSRNGAASVPLLHAKDWDVKSLWGSDFRIEIQAPNAVNLPTKEMGVSCRIRGQDLMPTIDPFTLKGYARYLAPMQQSVAVYGAEGQVVGIIGIDDALFIWSVVSMMRDIFALLRPSVDLMLPENISFTVRLDGDKFNVRFDSGPTVKLVWLFTFALKINTVTVSPTLIHAEFSGSRFIKSRDFQVIDGTASDPFPPASIPAPMPEVVEEEPIPRSEPAKRYNQTSSVRQSLPYG